MTASGSEFGAFLRSRRARLTPEAAGLPDTGRRRVPGLRREEVAALAAVSVDYVIRLEQGRVRPSEAVLDALSRALQLDPDEREHLFSLARPKLRAAAPAKATALRAGLARLVEAADPLPAYVVGPSLDLLAWNGSASALFGGLERRTAAERNIARMIFLDPDFTRLLGAPERVGGEVVAALRFAVTRHPGDAPAAALIDELLAASRAFATLWSRRDVRSKSHGRKSFAHPQVGPLELDWERLAIAEPAGAALMVYSTQPGTASATALVLLGTLGATQAQGAARA